MPLPTLLKLSPASQLRLLAALVVIAVTSGCLAGIGWYPKFEFAAEGMISHGQDDRPLQHVKHGPGRHSFTDEAVTVGIRRKRGRLYVQIGNRKESSIEALLHRMSYAEAKNRNWGLRQPSHKAPKQITIGSHEVVEVELWLTPPTGVRGFSSFTPKKAGARQLGADLVGRSFELTLPIRWEQSVRVYRFRFTARDFVVRMMTYA